MELVAFGEVNIKGAMVKAMVTFTSVPARGTNGKRFWPTRIEGTNKFEAEEDNGWELISSKASVIIPKPYDEDYELFTGSETYVSDNHDLKCLEYNNNKPLDINSLTYIWLIEEATKNLQENIDFELEALDKLISSQI
jgi:hypothetical protein